MRTTKATETELRDAIRSLIVPVNAALSGRPPPGARDALGAAVRSANELLLPAQTGVPAYDQLKALVYAAERAAAVHRAPDADARLVTALGAARDFLDAR